jgi:hypothetical protein
MEYFGLKPVVDILVQFGWGGLITLIWWVDAKRLSEQQRSYESRMSELLRRYERDMAKWRQMYTDNAELVRNYHKVASDLHDVVVLNTQVMQQLVSDVEKNQFCPMVRKEQG